ncbi:MAG: M20/M25/M40 family metallo-hydrolase, partial [Thermoplasmatota archaeon]
KELHWLDAVKLSTDSECVKKMLEITDTTTWAVPYGTEMVRFAKSNENTLICGPGKVDMAHKPNEYVEIPDLVDAVDVYVRYAKEMV